MDNLSDILSRKDFDLPSETVAIKNYVRRYYDKEIGVRVEPHTIIITAASSALISSLRMHVPGLQKAANTEKRILFRVQ
ncbi:MAG: hypothetical protein QG629_465 [Patescibacteria group bacterium]|nr:hypothetical protein [Candidatus Saccharibacteria bacterium]MDQ5963383.1 hypothetical protein [Patescibacteria group bacterium]